MQRVLLDTHVLLWSLSTPERLAAETRSLMDLARVFVSAASLWEVAIKYSLGKIDADPRKVLAALAPAGFELLPVTGEHAVGVSQLPTHHRDPFDRLLVSQAVCESLELLTNDDSLVPYGNVVKLLPSKH